MSAAEPITADEVVSASAAEPRRSTAVVEAAVAAAAGLVLAIFFTWPVAAHPASTVPGDLGDPLYQAWQLAWGGHALLHQPLHVFDANILYPLKNTLAFSDSLLGYAPLGLVGSGVGAALVRYNLAYLLAYTLAFAGTYVLARQLGCSRWAAAIAGLAFAYAPWRFAHNGHLNILSSGGIPLALACLARGHGYPGRGSFRPGWAIAGWAVAAWQLTIGFGLGLQFSYLVGIVVAGAVGTWLVRGRPALPRRLIAADAGGLALFLLVGALLSGPYLAAVDAHPEARRSQADVALFSPPAKSFFVAPAESRVWGPATEGTRKTLVSAPEQSLLVGGTVLVLALVGLVAGLFPLRRRLVLAGSALVLAVFAMGTKFAGGTATYLLLFEHAPGWQGVRTPGRLVTLVSLALCLLAATGADRLLGLVRQRVASAALGVVLLLLVAVEGLNTVGTPSPGKLPAGWAGVQGPVMQLPSDYFNDYAAMLWSTDGLPQIVNGTAGFTPRELDALRAQTAGFPDAASVAALRALGVRTVLLDTTRVGGTPWQDAAARSIEGLGIGRRTANSTVLFDLSASGQGRP